MLEAVALTLIIAIRLLVPLLVLRWAFWGGLACILADALDAIIPDALGVEVLEGVYHNVDKAFDLYYLAFEAWVARSWADLLARRAALTLFGLRFLAVIAFELTGERWLFLAGANVFENFFLFVSGMLVLDARYRMRTWRELAVILLFTGAPKLLQEYAMHFREFQTWDFVRKNILLPWRS